MTHHVNDNCLLHKFSRFLLTGKHDDTLMDNINGVPCVHDLIERKGVRQVLSLLLDDRYRKLLSYYPAVQTLVTMVTYGDEDVQRQGWDALPVVCHNPPRMFYFQVMYARLRQYTKDNALENAGDDREQEIDIPEANPSLRSKFWTSKRRRATSRFYTDPQKPASLLLFHLTKYKKRHKISHMHLLRYCHNSVVIDPADDEKDAKKIVLIYVEHGYRMLYTRFPQYFPAQENLFINIPADPAQTVIVSQCLSRVVQYIVALENLKHANKENVLGILQTYIVREACLVNNCPDDEQKDPFRLTWEHVPSECLRMTEVWSLLVRNMPVYCTLRNIPKMTRMGVFDIVETRDIVVRRIQGLRTRQQNFLHPMVMLKAWIDCKFNFRPKRLSVPGDITEALEESILYFKPTNQEPFGLNVMIAVETGIEIATNNRNRRGVNRGKLLSRRQYSAGLLVMLRQLFVNCVFYEFTDTTQRRDALPSLSDMISFITRGTSFFEQKKQRPRYAITRRRNAARQARRGGHHRRGGQHGNNMAPEQPRRNILPMQESLKWPIDKAIETRKRFDLFIIITDTDKTTAHKNIIQKLREYQTQINENAKLIVVNLFNGPYTAEVEEGRAPESRGRVSAERMINYSIGTRNTLDVCGYRADLLDIIALFLNRHSVLEECPCCVPVENEEN